MAQKPPVVLNSWKEIAHHLGVSVRTAQLWEQKRRLPVRRLPDDPDSGGSGTVFAYAEEIEVWRRDGAQAGNSAPTSPSRRVPRTALLGGAGLAAVLATLAASSIVTPQLSAPATATIDDEVLRVFDAEGAELWRAEFDAPLRTSGYAHPRYAPRIVDISGDMRPEVLLPVLPGDNTRSHELVCYSPDGEEMWRFRPGRTVTVGGRAGEEILPDVYRMGSVASVRLAGGERHVVVVSSHDFEYPTQIALLTGNGELQGEYWHAGHVGTRPDQFLVTDLDGRAGDEIYLGGIDNDRSRAVLVVLDPGRIMGTVAAAEHRPVYRFTELPPAQEMARVWFPRTPVSEATTDPYNGVTHLQVRGGLLVVSVKESLMDPAGPTIIYEFNPDLTFRRISPSSSYIGLYRSLFGASDESFTELMRSLRPIYGVGPDAERAGG